MGELASATLAVLRRAAETGILGDAVEQAIALAADLLVKARAPEVGPVEVTAEEGRELAQALLDLLQRHPQSALAGSIIWALGKARDPANVPAFTAQLERGVRLLLEGNRLVFQALCALDDAGQDAFERDDSGRSSQGLTAPEKNLAQARAYLARHGVLVPW